MTTSDPEIAAARNAERELWRHYGVTVVERFIDIDHPRLRIRLLECGNPSAEPLMFVQGGLGEAWGWARGSPTSDALRSTVPAAG